jgi:serine/threonine protein kinase
MAQIIDGCNNIFRRNIVHSDLKLANIFLRNKEIQIADLGFAVKNSLSKKFFFL